MENSFSLLLTIAMILKNCFFLVSMEPLLENQIHSSQSSSLSTQTTLTVKNWNQTDETT